MAYSRPAKDFIQKSASVLNWGTGNDSVVMDIGCGDGTNSTKYLIECLPEMRKLVAIDSNVIAIFDATDRTSHPKVNYNIADIVQRDTLNPWFGRIDKIFSNYCFSLTKDQGRAFRNVYHLLVPGGSAALCFVLQAPLYDWMEEIFSRWRQFNNGLEVNAPQSHVENWNAGNYEAILRKMGFKVILCETEVQNYKQETGEACKDYLFRMCPLSPMIPEKMAQAYRDDMYSAFLKHCCIFEGEEVFAVITVLKVLLEKPS